MVIGPNVFEGEVPNYHLSFLEGGQGCDITYEAMVEPWMPKEPIGAIGGAPVGWLVAQARSKISGTMTWDGKTMEVKGEGYHDHNWADAPISGEGGGEYGFWGRLYIGDWTFNWGGGRASRKRSYEPNARVICYKKDKVVAVSDKGGGLGSDYTIKGTGIEYPQTTRLWWNAPGVVEGQVNYKLNQLIEFMDLHSRFKPFQRWYAETFVGRPAYFRYRLDYDADLTIAGEKVTGKGLAWCEHHKYI